MKRFFISLLAATAMVLMAIPAAHATPSKVTTEAFAASGICGYTLCSDYATPVQLKGVHQVLVVFRLPTGGGLRTERPYPEANSITAYTAYRVGPFEVGWRVMI